MKFSLKTIFLAAVLNVCSVSGDWTKVGGDLHGEAGDFAGFSVSMSSDGKIVAMGARADDDKPGSVGVYELVDNSWKKVGSDIEGEVNGEWFGRSVSISSDGSIVAIGANKFDSEKGRVRVYKLSNGGWIPLGDDIIGKAAGDRFGDSVSISSDGNKIAVGGQYHDENGTNVGHVQVYNLNDNIWVQVGNDILGEASGDNFGRSVSISSDGSTVAIGAHYNDENGENSGHVRVFRLNANNQWEQIGNDLDGEAVDDSSGSSVSLSSDGTIVAIGAYLNDGENLDSPVGIRGLFSEEVSTDAGHVRVYRFDDEEKDWVQMGNDIDGEAAYDKSGVSVSLSSDGTIIAIGAYHNDGNVEDSGHVRVFHFHDISNTWVKVGSDIDGKSSGDLCGLSVSISSDGSMVAIGSPGNKVNGSNSGQVQIYRNDKLSDAPSAQPSVLPSSVTSLVPSSKPSLEPSLKPSTIQSVSPSLEPSTKPSVVPSIEPSLKPSDVPSSAPSIKPSQSVHSSHLPSMMPSNQPSSRPSSEPSTIPTELAQKNATQAYLDWKISMIGDVDVNFDEDNSSEEINFYLNISEAQVDELQPITIHQYDDCNSNKIPTDVLQATAMIEAATTIEASPGYKQVEVMLDAKIDNVFNNNDVFEYKTGSNKETAYLSFCVAANLGEIDVYDGGAKSSSSISYLHILFNITISLSQGFQTTSVDIVEIGPEDIEDDVKVSYNLASCECVPSSKICLSEDEVVIYNQNSELNICVFTPDDEDDIQIRDIKTMDIEQNTGITLRAIDNYVANAITSVSDGNEKRMLVSTRTVSAFFTDENAAQLLIRGIAIIEFVDGRRLMTMHGDSGRVIQEEGDGEGSFQLEVNISPAEESTTESSSFHNYCAITRMSSIILLAFGTAIYDNWN